VGRIADQVGTLPFRAVDSHLAISSFTNNKTRYPIEITGFALVTGARFELTIFRL
jgi:hypothetical protein